MGLAIAVALFFVPATAAPSGVAAHMARVCAPQLCRPASTVEVRTIVVKLEQLDKKELDRHTLLTVTNPFARALRYRAGLQRPESDQAFATSTCPVEVGKQSFEHWPEPLSRVFMKDLHLVAPGSNESKGCD